MLIASYERWREAKVQLLEEENPLVDCPECGGSGDIHSVCPCCDGEKEEECDVCGGEGHFSYRDSPKPRPGNDLAGPEVYFREVISDLKKWCAITRKDFLQVGGEFVSEFRRQHGIRTRHGIIKYSGRP